MDKSKVKFLLIVFAVVLAIVILYRLFSGVAESTVEKKKAQDKADAELYAQMKKDEYTDGREEETKAEKARIMEQQTENSGLEIVNPKAELEGLLDSAETADVSESEEENAVKAEEVSEAPVEKSDTTKEDVVEAGDEELLEENKKETTEEITE